MRTRWPDENRREVAKRYATAAAKYKQELLGLHRGGPSHREAVEALRGLNPWAKRAKFEELVRWLGEFDSARTLVEEWPAMGRFTQPDVWVHSGGTNSYSVSKRVGGPPPEWMRGWLPLVSEWQGRQDREERSTTFAAVVGQALKQVYTREIVEKMVQVESPFWKALSK